ncbi:MAG: aminopeptidase [Caldithrix sp.]|nr:MAG: aminopeptidase [Caldithrix sp.]
MNKDGFKISPDKDIKTTPVKNQAHTNTCWSFSTISFVETELLRMGKEPHNLSEMFVVRKTYPRKSERYIRLHGNMSFGAQSLSGDVLYVIRKHGIVPESVFAGRPDGQSQYDNEEMDAVLNASLDAIISKKRRRLSKVWPKAIDGILDAYLGQAPESFSFNGQSYTPKSFAEELGFDPDDYIELTSYSHHPFYTTFSLEVPDNWSLNKYLNVPLDELMSVIDHAIQNGYSLGWDGDISENSFSQKRGVAILPVKEWEERTKEERNELCDVPEPEIEVTQEFRQEAFDNFTSTDDHLMHITGMAYDQNGTKYYKAKNSWGQKESKYEGFIYLSESYVRAKTISIMVHKEALLNKIVQQLQGKTKESIGETWFFKTLKDKKS